MGTYASPPITFRDAVHVIHWKINVFSFVVTLLYVNKHYCHD